MKSVQYGFCKIGLRNTSFRQKNCRLLGGGVQPHLGPWPLTKNLLAMAYMMGLSGPNFFIVVLAYKCDETNFKLLLKLFFFQKYIFPVNISVRFPIILKR